MALSASNRSQSLPHVNPSSGYSHRRSSSRHRHNEESSEPFHLAGGFFPRSNSFYGSLNKLEKDECEWAQTGDSEQREYLYGALVSSYDDDEVVDRRRSHSKSSSNTSPQTPVTGIDEDIEATTSRLALLSPTEDAEFTKAFISSEDKMGILAFTEASKARLTSLRRSATENPSSKYVAPLYDHDHLFHSYDVLYRELSERRRSATHPDLVTGFGAARTTSRWMYNNDDTTTGRRQTAASSRRYNGDVIGQSTIGQNRRPQPRKKKSSQMFLFSPTEEGLQMNFSDEDNESDDGNEIDEDKTGLERSQSWGEYLFDNARKLWDMSPSMSRADAPYGY